jgi:diguanylate cyclase (GGDEF)-like protein
MHDTTDLPLKKESLFEGFDELIKEPLEKEDQKSLHKIEGLFSESDSFRANPFSFLIKRLSGKSFTEYKAREHWRNIIAHKKDMESKLNRIIRIQTAAVDYFSIISEMDYSAFVNNGQSQRDPKGGDEWFERIYSPNFYTEKLREEISRAKRYSHALSLIMLGIDDIDAMVKENSLEYGDKVVKFIIKVVKKTVRTVDIIARYSGERYLIILPNTNKREAIELAERLRENVNTRGERSPEINREISITLSVTQCGPDDKSIDITKRMESVLEGGRQQQQNKVYSL